MICAYGQTYGQTYGLTTLTVLFNSVNPYKLKSCCLRVFVKKILFICVKNVIDYVLIERNDRRGSWIEMVF